MFARTFTGGSKQRLAGLVLLVGATLGVTACSATDHSELRQITHAPADAIKQAPNGQPDYTGLAPASVWVDAWEEDGNDGDQAHVEKKPSGLWVIPLDAPFRTQHEPGFDIRIALTATGDWLILEVKPGANTRLGLDHDNCLEDGEAYAKMTLPAASLAFEADKGGGNDNDGCYTRAEEN